MQKSGLIIWKVPVATTTILLPEVSFTSAVNKDYACRASML